MLTAEQKQKRIGKITSSVAAAVLGVDEDMSAIDACLEITGQGPGDDEMSEDKAKACERGNVLEGPTIAWGARQLGMDVVEAPFRQHADYDWLGDSADALYTPLRDGKLYSVVEAKTVALGGAHYYGREGTDDIKTHALIQSHHHLIHWPDASHCDVPVCLGGYEFEFRLYRVSRDLGFQEELINRLGEWYHEYIVGGRVPPATWRDSDKAWLVKRFGAYRETEPLEATAEIEYEARQKALASQRVKLAKIDENLAKNRLRELLGHYELTQGGWGRVTCRDNRASVFVDYEAMANAFLSELPDSEVRERVIACYTGEKPGNKQVLRVNLSKALKKELEL